MIKGTAVKEVRFKDGHSILKGETLIIQWPDPRLDPTRVEVLHKDRSLHTRAVSALGWIGRTCSEEVLGEAVMDSVCETPNGTTVEPDGVDSEGAPFVADDSRAHVMAPRESKGTLFRSWRS